MGVREVYNLEVKDWHNFLVGSEGIVVHNGCLKEYLDFLFKPIFGKWTKKKVSGKKWVSYIEESGIPDAKEIKQYEVLGEKTGKRFLGIETSPKNPNQKMSGIDGFTESGKAISLKQAESASTGGTLMSEMVEKADKLNKGTIAGHEDLAGLFNKIDGMLTAKKSDK